MISVIIPTHNDSRDLEKSLFSCKYQRCVTEIIVVDDCSSKDHVPLVVELCDNYKAKYIRNDINYGLAGARNNGIHQAKNMWIIPLDTGDTFYDNGVDDLYDYATQDTMLHDIYYGCITDRYPRNHPKSHIAYPNKNITKESFLKENPLFCSSLYSKDIWIKAGGYTMRPYSFYEDYDFWCKCFSVGAQFQYVNALIYHHANNGSSMLSELHSNTDKYKEMARVGLEYGTNKKCYKPRW
jgi:glycosyltransferase involved in cell wall biosynthesis